MKRWSILSTRKLEPSFVKRSGEKGYDITEIEFIAVRHILNAELAQQLSSFAQKGVLNMIITSANGVEALKQLNACNNIPWRFYCLAGATKEAIRSHTGIFSKDIRAEAANASELANLITTENVKEAIFLCGNKRRDDLPSILKQHGIVVHEVIAYETIETPVKTGQPFDAVLFFSPSAVRSFFSVNQLSSTTVCFSIGETTAQELKRFTGNRIIVADFPSQETMIWLVEKYFKQV